MPGGRRRQGVNGCPTAAMQQQAERQGPRAKRRAARIPQRIGCMLDPGPATMGLAVGGSRIWGQGGLGRGDWMRRIGSGIGICQTDHGPCIHPCHLNLTSSRCLSSHSLPSCPTWWLFQKTGACSTSSGRQVTGRAAQTAASSSRLKRMDGWMSDARLGPGAASMSRPGLLSTTRSHRL